MKCLHGLLQLAQVGLQLASCLLQFVSIELLYHLCCFRHLPFASRAPTDMALDPQDEEYCRLQPLFKDTPAEQLAYVIRIRALLVLHEVYRSDAELDFLARTFPSHVSCPANPSTIDALSMHTHSTLLASTPPVTSPDLEDIDITSLRRFHNAPSYQALNFESKVIRTRRGRRPPVVVIGGSAVYGRDPMPPFKLAVWTFAERRVGELEKHPKAHLLDGKGGWLEEVKK
jgi:hypothetical protein